MAAANRRGMAPPSSPAPASQPATTPAGSVPPAATVLLEDLARFRQAVYRLLGAGFLYPDTDRLQALREVRRSRSLHWEGARWMAVFGDWQRWLAAAGAACAPGSSRRRRLEAEYVRLFAVGPARPLCPPYESWFAGGQGPSMGQVGETVVALQRVYASCGLRVAPQLGGEPADHVAVELEFLSFLCGQEAEGWNGPDPAPALGWLGQQERFLVNHVTRWVPALCRRLARVAHEPFYRELGRFCEGWLWHDLRWVQAMGLQVQAPAPAPGLHVRALATLGPPEGAAG